MNWYYAKDGQQQGPVSDAEFQTLVAQGVIKPETLVWREGLPAWVAWSTQAGATGAGPGATAAPVAFGEAPPAGVQCVQCGQWFGPGQVIDIGGRNVCSGCKPVYVQRFREGVANPVHLPGGQPVMRYAGFWIRFAASIIDQFVLVVVIMPLSLVFGFGAAVVNFNPANRVDLGAQLVVQVIVIVVTVIYEWLMVARFGATLGKMAVGVKVVNADGSRVGNGRAFGRAWAQILSQLVCCIGYIIAAFDDQKRAMHDHICNTRVIYK